MLVQYKDYAATAQDVKGFHLTERQDWYVAPVRYNRDCTILEESNFSAARECFDCSNHTGSTAEVHTFGHGTLGWYQIILVHPSRAQEVQALAERLGNDPILAEAAYKEKCKKLAHQMWKYLTLEEKVWYCTQHGESPFSARLSYPPCDEIEEALIRE